MIDAHRATSVRVRCSCEDLVYILKRVCCIRTQLIVMWVGVGVESVLLAWYWSNVGTVGLVLYVEIALQLRWGIFV